MLKKTGRAGGVDYYSLELALDEWDYVAAVLLENQEHDAGAMSIVRDIEATRRYFEQLNEEEA